MTTVVNNPGGSSDGSGMGFLVGAIVLIAFVFLFFVYGLPMIRQSSSGVTPPSVNVPEKIDVNLNQGQAK